MAERSGEFRRGPLEQVAHVAAVAFDVAKEAVIEVLNQGLMRRSVFEERYFEQQAKKLTRLN